MGGKACQATKAHREGFALMAEITVRQAVDRLYTGQANLIKASKAAECDPEILKALLLDRVQNSNDFAPRQLTLILTNEDEPPSRSGP